MKKKGDDHRKAMMKPTLEEETKRQPERQQATTNLKAPGKPRDGR